MCVVRACGRECLRNENSRPMLVRRQGRPMRYTFHALGHVFVTTYSSPSCHESATAIGEVPPMPGSDPRDEARPHISGPSAADRQASGSAEEASGRFRHPARRAGKVGQLFARHAMPVSRTSPASVPTCGVFMGACACIRAHAHLADSVNLSALPKVHPLGAGAVLVTVPSLASSCPDSKTQLSYSSRTSGGGHFTPTSYELFLSLSHSDYYLFIFSLSIFPFVFPPPTTKASVDI